MFSGQRLKEIREAQGMSQASVAKHLGISRSSYFNWENGKTKPNQKNLSVLAELFGVAETYFLSEHEIVEVYLELNEENRQEALRPTRTLLSRKHLLFPFTLTKFSSVYQPEQVTLTLEMATMMKFSMMKNWIMILHHGYLETLWNLPT